MMTINLTPLSPIIEKLRQDLLASEEPNLAMKRRVALLTKGLPVYNDMGGYLSLHPVEGVLFYDLDSETVSEMTEEYWVRMARVAAAEEYPELLDLYPVRPSTAKDCSLCGGTGKVSLTIVLRCGICCGLGWCE